MLRIAMYYPWIYLTSGVERVILETCKRSKHSITLFTNRYERENSFPELVNYGIVELKPVSVRRNLLQVFHASMIIASQVLDLSGFDALVVHCEGLGDLITIRNKRRPTLCYCHTPLRPVFDFKYRQRVLKDRFFSKLLFHIFSNWFRRLDKILWRNYDLILCNSQETHRRAVLGGLVQENDTRLRILNPGIDERLLWMPSTTQPYFLVAGRMMWTKNIELALASFKVFKSLYTGSKFKLIVAGAVDRKSEKYYRGLQQMADEIGEIDFITNPPDKELRKLYQNCFALLYSPFNEDWGMVPLEANAYGKPVIAVNSGGPKESQVHGKTGFLVPPTPAAFCTAMQRLVSDSVLYDQMSNGARQNAEKYTWESFVHQFDDYLEFLVNWKTRICMRAKEIRPLRTRKARIEVDALSNRANETELVQRKFHSENKFEASI